jgi:hypothetical protein
MDSHLMGNATHRNPGNLDRISEMDILSDIDYFRARLAELPVNADRYARARRHVYITLLQQRRRLLAALRAGRPEDWPEFPVDEAHS